MTSATAPSPSARLELADPPRRKPKVGFGDLVALTMRQHRLALGCTVLLYVLFGLLIQLTQGEASIGYWRFDPKDYAAALAGVIAMFWGAPLLATEYEQRTTVLVWSQDVSPVRWLLAKLTLLSGAVVVLSSLMALLVRSQAAEEYGRSPSPYSPLGVFGSVGYEAWLPLSLAYAVFGFLFGVAVGALFRRTVTAIGVTLVGFGAIRFLVAYVLRPWLVNNLITPVRQTWSMSTWITPDPHAATGAGPRDFLVNSQIWLDHTGKVVYIPDACYSVTGIKPFGNCMMANGVAATGEDYQPFSRLVIFQSVELAVYVVLIVVCLGVALWSVRRKASI
jgi:hypothetical protein